MPSSTFKSLVALNTVLIPLCITVGTCTKIIMVACGDTNSVHVVGNQIEKQA